MYCEVLFLVQSNASSAFVVRRDYTVESGSSKFVRVVLRTPNSHTNLNKHLLYVALLKLYIIVLVYLMKNTMSSRVLHSELVRPREARRNIFEARRNIFILGYYVNKEFVNSIAQPHV